jgi:type VI secretion system ImpC/EvpB family protein
MDSVLEATQARRAQVGGLLDEFLREPSPWHALLLWLGPSARERVPSKTQIARQLVRDLARLDAVLTAQVNAILHHPGFQRLEGSWNSLRYLVGQVPAGENIKVRMLSVTWKELTRDLERALEFDQSQLFHKIYDDEFGMPGGEPFSVLIGDYEVRHRPGPEHPYDDVTTLTRISSVAAAAFAPFIAAVHPSVLELESFAELERPLNLAKTFEQLDYLKWRAFRQTEDSRFVGLTLPRILLRVPYGDEGPRVDGFRFREEVGEPDRHQYLWGSAAYAFGVVLVRAFSESGWLADIRGVRTDGAGGGMVTGLPVLTCPTDRAGLVPRCSTEVMITDAQEQELGDLGLIPLCHCPDTDIASFYGNQSAQRPKSYDTRAATANARLSAMIQYMLCVSRFAHYLKVLARDKVGSFQGPSECEDFLHRWLTNYTLADDAADLETKARFPLREAQVQMREHPGKPGKYLAVFHLRPHFQLDQVVTSVRLTTEVAPVRAG